MQEKIKNVMPFLFEEGSVRQYLNQFGNYKIISEDVEDDNSEITILCDDELIKILFINISYAKWYSIYRYNKVGVKYEQIDFIMYDEVRDIGYNKIIKYSGHIEDDKYSYIMCSSFSYLNNDVVKSWRKTRVVPVEDLQFIQYSKDQNLTELIIMADGKSKNIIGKDDQKDLKTLVLKLDKSS